MPIYEFYCDPCHTVFNFFSQTVNTSKTPDCPRCGGTLSRQVSLFSTTSGGGSGEEGDDMLDNLPIDEGRMEDAINALAGEAESIGDDDPRQAAQLMRKFSKMTGMAFGEGMETALQRMEAGEDPDRIEQEMGDVLENEDPFVIAGKKLRAQGDKRSRGAPRRDETLYDL